MPGGRYPLHVVQGVSVPRDRPDVENRVSRAREVALRHVDFAGKVDRRANTFSFRAIDPALIQPTTYLSDKRPGGVVVRSARLKTAVMDAPLEFIKDSKLPGGPRTRLRHVVLYATANDKLRVAVKLTNNQAMVWPASIRSLLRTYGKSRLVIASRS